MRFFVLDNECDNCGRDEANGCCSLDGLLFCSEECLDTYLTGGQGLLSASPQTSVSSDHMNMYETSFYVYIEKNYIHKDNI